MTVRVAAFARVREILGAPARDVELPDGATAGDAWRALEASAPDLSQLRASTRLARNGAFVDGTAVLTNGDELALLPPVGGG